MIKIIFSFVTGGFAMVTRKAYFTQMLYKEMVNNKYEKRSKKVKIHPIANAIPDTDTNRKSEGSFDDEGKIRIPSCLEWHYFVSIFCSQRAWYKEYSRKIDKVEKDIS